MSLYRQRLIPVSVRTTPLPVIICFEFMLFCKLKKNVSKLSVGTMNTFYTNAVDLCFDSNIKTSKHKTRPYLFKSSSLFRISEVKSACVGAATWSSMKSFPKLFHSCYLQRSTERYCVYFLYYLISDFNYVITITQQSVHSTLCLLFVLGIISILDRWNIRQAKRV